MALSPCCLPSSSWALAMELPSLPPRLCLSVSNGSASVVAIVTPEFDQRKLKSQPARFLRRESLHEIIRHLHSDTDVSTYASLLQRCTAEKAVAAGELVHGHLIMHGHADNRHLNNLLVQMYGKYGSFQHARAVFDNMVNRDVCSWTIMLAACARNGSLDDARVLFATMPERDVVSWNVMITACAQNGHGNEAIQLFDQMEAKGFDENKITFICVLDACSSVAALERGRQIHASVVGCGWACDVVVGTALIDMYGKCGSMDDARAVFVEMPQRNLVSWNAMLAACVHNGHSKKALVLFGQLQEEGFKPNKITFTSILDACANIAALEEGREIHANLVQDGWEFDIIMANALVNMYGKCRSVEDARAVFAEMPRHDVALWSALIAAYAQNEHGMEALQLLDQMQADGFEPNKITLICVLDGCASVAALEKGREIHASVVGNGWESDVVVGGALVNMYGKCGSLDDARSVFIEMPSRTVVSWSAMIAVCAQNGHGKEALQLFDKMQAENIKPNAITFISVLTACSHMGLVADGTRYFSSMTVDHGITPSVDHYVCMIDLLGRAGLLEKAEQLINSMPYEPIASAWLSFLSSCKIHGDIERGVQTAKRVFDRVGKNPSLHVLLANILAEERRWDDVENVKKAMIDNGVQKVRGQSFIEVKNVVHKFVVGDVTHPEWEHIRAELQKLCSQMEEAGYVPDTTALLRHLGEEHLEQILYGHSENLAITFGFMSTPLGAPIRITTNLRMCTDCHSAIKFMSKVVHRKIIVRDTSCFHHIEGGVCSCGEFW